MNIEYLRKTLKAQWLNYYRENRSWLTRLGIWVNCDGKRRPSSSFILGTLTTLEPQLLHILPLVVDLSSNPDRIILALGLNFNPDEEIEAIGELDRSSARSLPASKVTALPNGQTASQPQRQTESAPELRSAKSEVATPPSRPPQPDPAKTQVTVPVRKIVDPPEPALETSQAETSQARAKQSAKPNAGTQPGAENKPDTAKPSGVPDLPIDRPSRFPPNGSTTPDHRLASRRPPIDTATLSAGQLPDRDPSDLDSTAQPAEDARI